jgi:aryl-alcohol dehydrogenase-like predicted oxidoreductase
MRYRALGRTGLTVSEVGFGTWGLGGTSYGPVDDGESRLALELAFDRGVTFYDTSDLYGDGHSEEVLGRVFATRRREILIATKVGMLPHTGFDMPQDFSAGRIAAGVEASLRRLGTDYIDLYQLHSPQMDLPNWDEILGALERLRANGTIRAYGLSARSPSDAAMAVERYGVAVVQVNFNLIDHRATDDGLLALCAARGVGVIARTPLCFGFLSGRLTGEETFAAGDHRANWPREQLRRWASAPAVFRSVIQDDRRTLVHLALQWCLSNPAVSTAIPGMLTRAEVEEDTAVTAFPPLTEAEVIAIRRAYREHVFYDPSAKQPQPAGGPGAAVQGALKVTSL